MKEITRRLYTKPVMLGMAFLVGAMLVVGLFVTSTSNAASTFIPKGDDRFETTGNGETFHNFGAVPVPAGFFGTTSEAFSGVVPLVGVPIAGEGDIDTIITRVDDVQTPGVTNLKMKAINLASINNITVTYSDPGKPDEQWSMTVTLSTLRASTGTMTIHSGGTFDSSLNVFPKFTFRRISDNFTKVWDTGSSTGPNALALAEASKARVFNDEIAAEPAPAPVPAPTVAPAPCHISTIDVSSTQMAIPADERSLEGRISAEAESRVSADITRFAAVATRSCAPVRLTSTNTPWGHCPGFCIPRPMTEAELWASHNASPPGTKKLNAAKGGGAAAE
ncbi:MAG TPA: hypothetical protein VJT15_09470 [Pyrinomonadaceae bacterium]|nr:hypothetical protein [Pyrinomonadaceae bacterium]